MLAALAASVRIISETRNTRIGLVSVHYLGRDSRQPVVANSTRVDEMITVTLRPFTMS